MSGRLEQLTDRVDEFLLRMGLEGDVTADGFWTGRFGSTVLLVSIFEDGPHTYVRLAAVVLVGAQTSLDLLTRLLRLNSETRFGAFQLFDDQTVAFTHTLVADHMPYEVFEYALRYVGQVADDHDEELQALAGGERGEDVVGEPPS